MTLGLTGSRLSQVSPCNINHRTLNFVPCAKNVVYSLPLACGIVYIGRTSRGINHILGQRRINNADNNLAEHLQLCSNCRPLWDEPPILAYGPVLLKHLLRESVALHSVGNYTMQAFLLFLPNSLLIMSSLGLSFQASLFFFPSLMVLPLFFLCYDVYMSYVTVCEYKAEIRAWFWVPLVVSFSLPKLGLFRPCSKTILSLQRSIFNRILNTFPNI